MSLVPGVVDTEMSGPTLASAARSEGDCYPLVTDLRIGRDVDQEGAGHAVVQLHDNAGKPEGDGDNGSNSEPKDFLDDENMALESSVWDASMLVGLRHDGVLLFDWVTAVLLFVLMIANSSVQLTVVFAIDSSMASDPLSSDNLKSFAVQRLIDNHKLSSMNYADMMTPTKELCSGLRYNLLGDSMGSLANYLQVNEDGDSVAGSFNVPGYVVSSLAMLIWILSMLSEFRRTLEVMTAILKMQVKERDASDVVWDQEEDCYVVSQMSLVRKIWCVGIFMIRMIVASLLLFWGLKFLCYTYSVSDLILNSCALEVVKDIDEKIFDAICALRTKLTVENSRLKFARPKSKVVAHGLLSVRLGFIVAAFIVGLNWLIPFRSAVKDALDIVCRGDKDFVYVTHPVVNLPFFSTTASRDNDTYLDPSPLHLKCFYHARYEIVALRAGEPLLGKLHELGAMKNTWNASTRALIDGTDPQCTETNTDLCMEVPLSKLEDFPSTDSDSFYQDRMSCKDHHTHFNIVRETCLHGDYADSPLDWLHDRDSCSHFSNICRCTGNPCGPPSFTDIIEQYKIPFDWIKVLWGLCPASCGLCQTGGGGAGMGGAPTGNSGNQSSSGLGSSGSGNQQSSQSGSSGSGNQLDASSSGAGAGSSGGGTPSGGATTTTVAAGSSGGGAPSGGAATTTVAAGSSGGGAPSSGAGGATTTTVASGASGSGTPGSGGGGGGPGGRRLEDELEAGLEREASLQRRVLELEAQHEATERRLSALEDLLHAAGRI